MRDAIGGTVNIVLIAVFMVLVSGYMAFNVSYVKAFKVKNKIIDLVEQYEGKCDPGDATNKCTKKIRTYMQEIGYNTPTKIIGSEFPAKSCDLQRGYCIKEMKVDTAMVSKGEKKAYYKVMTQVNIDIPIINSLMPYLRVFQVTGDTQTITVRE